MGNAKSSIFESSLTANSATSSNWEMSRKIARFKKQKGYGAETNFSTDVCQGNFDHHGSWALKAYEERLKALSLWERVG